MYFYNPEPGLDSVGAAALAATIETKQQAFPLDALETEPRAIEWINAVEGDSSLVAIKNGSQPRHYVNTNVANASDMEIRDRNGKHTLTLCFTLQIFHCLRYACMQ